jgi:pilus assembly protein CpaE
MASVESSGSPLVLVVESGSGLTEEVESGLRRLAGVRFRCRTAREFHSAVELARQLQPDGCVLELTDDLPRLRSLSAELQAVAPRMKLVAAFRSEDFPPETSESVLMIQAIRAGIQDFLRRPIALQDLSELFERIARQRVASAAALGTLVSFVSNKGGVGKSTMSVNAAVGVAMRRPERVLLVDCSLQMGVCAMLLDLRPATTLHDALRQRDRLDETLLRQLAAPHDSGLDLMAAPATAAQAAEIDAAFIAQLLTLARRAYDIVIVDTFPMLDGIVMAALDLSSRAYVVLENVVPTLIGGAAFIQLLKQLGFGPEVVRVVLNQYTTAAGNPSLADTERRLELPVDFIIPSHRKIQAAANLGRPFILSANRWWQPGKGMLSLVNDIDSLRSADPRDGSQNSGTSAPVPSAPVPSAPVPNAIPGLRVSGNRDGSRPADADANADFGADT